jgi:hypothetical protein
LALCCRTTAILRLHTDRQNVRCGGAAAIVEHTASMSLSNFPPLLCGPPFCIALYWVATALGNRIVRLVRVPVDEFSPLERGLVCAAVGAGSLQYLPMALSAFGKLSAVPIRVAVALVSAILIPDLMLVARGVWRAIALRQTRLSKATALWSCSLFLLLAVLFLHSLVLGKTGDDDGYHLTAPRRWLEAGSLIYLPTYLPTNAPMGFEMLYLLSLACWNASGAKLLHFGAGILCLLGVFLCGKRVAGAQGGFCAISLMMIPNPLYDFPFQFGQAYIDLSVCWMTITTVFLYLAWRRRPDAKLLALAAVCAGFAASFKLPALTVGCTLAIVVQLTGIRQGLSWFRATSRAAGCAVLSLAPVLPWFYRDWRLTGNALFPLLSGVIPTRDWSREQGRLFSEFARYHTWATSLGFLGETQRRWLLLLAAVAMCAAFVGSAIALKRPELRDLLAFSFLPMLASLGVTGLYFRYWLPAITILCLLAGCLLSNRPGRQQRAVWAGAAAMALSVGVWMTQIIKDPNGFLGNLRVVAGMSSVDEEYDDDPLWRIWRYINARTPKDARILLASFFTTFGPTTGGGAFWVDRPCYATDSHLQGFIRLDDWLSFLQSVRDAGIDFVVISDVESQAGRHGMVFPAAQNEYRFSRRLVDEYGSLLRQYDHAQLYRLQALPVAAR